MVTHGRRPVKPPSVPRRELGGDREPDGVPRPGACPRIAAGRDEAHEARQSDESDRLHVLRMTGWCIQLLAGGSGIWFTSRAVGAN